MAAIGVTTNQISTSQLQMIWLRQATKGKTWIHYADQFWVVV